MLLRARRPVTALLRGARPGDAGRRDRREGLLCHQLGLVRAALTGAHPRIGQEVLALLVLERRVTIDDVRAALARYRLGGGG